MATVIVSGYVGHINITQKRCLYYEEDPRWPEQAKRLFRCSSRITDSNELLHSIAEMAKEKGWQVPAGAKLFLQITQQQMLDEFIDILISPLKR